MQVLTTRDGVECAPACSRRLSPSCHAAQVISQRGRSSGGDVRRCACSRFGVMTHVPRDGPAARAGPTRFATTHALAFTSNAAKIPREARGLRVQQEIRGLKMVTQVQLDPSLRSG